MIACDLQATHSSGHKFKTSTKIMAFEQPLLYPYPFYVGFSGGINNIPNIVDYFMNIEEYKKPPKMDGSECLVLTANKKMFSFTEPNKWFEVQNPYYAVGSGASLALGAMEAGKTPLEAVKIAGKRDIYTGMGYRFFKFK